MQHLILIWSYDHLVISNSWYLIPLYQNPLYQIHFISFRYIKTPLYRIHYGHSYYNFWLCPIYLCCSGLNLMRFNWNKFRKISTVNMIHLLNQIWGKGHTEPNSTKLLTEPNLLNLISIEPISQQSFGLNLRFCWSELNYHNFSYLNSRIGRSEPNYQNLVYFISS